MIISIHAYVLPEGLCGNFDEDASNDNLLQTGEASVEGSEHPTDLIDSWSWVENVS